MITLRDKKNIYRLNKDERLPNPAIAKLYNVTRQRIQQIISGIDKHQKKKQVFSFMDQPLETMICIKCQATKATDRVKLTRTIEVDLCKGCQFIMKK
jgi:predicted regulator of amino acid metabolism with ACT domain